MLRLSATKPTTCSSYIGVAISFINYLVNYKVLLFGLTHHAITLLVGPEPLRAVLLTTPRVARSTLAKIQTLLLPANLAGADKIVLVVIAKPPWPTNTIATEFHVAKTERLPTPVNLACAYKIA